MINDLTNRFSFHPADTQDKHGEVRATMWRAAEYLSDNLPDCRETSLAVTKLEEAMMWANAAVARNG